MVLEELSELFQRDTISRPSSCRSVLIGEEETPMRYWKDDVKTLINQYILEFPNGIKRAYLYSHIPANFRYNTMLAGLCNLCDEYGHSNFDMINSILSDIEAKGISMKEVKPKILKYQQYLKTQFSKQATRHSQCLELCMDHGFGCCNEPHVSCSEEASSIYEIKQSVTDAIGGIAVKMKEKS